MFLGLLHINSENKKKYFQSLIVNNLFILSGFSAAFFYIVSLLCSSKIYQSSYIHSLERFGVTLNAKQIEDVQNLIKKINKKNNSLLKITIPAAIISAICLVVFYFLSEKIGKQKCEKKQNLPKTQKENKNDKQKILAGICLLTCYAIIFAELIFLSCAVCFILDHFSDIPMFKNILPGVNLEILYSLDLPLEQTNIIKDSMKPNSTVALACLIAIIAIIAIATYFCTQLIVKPEARIMNFCFDEIKCVKRNQSEEHQR